MGKPRIGNRQSIHPRGPHIRRPRQRRRLFLGNAQRRNHPARATPRVSPPTTSTIPTRSIPFLNLERVWPKSKRRNCLVKLYCCRPSPPIKCPCHTFSKMARTLWACPARRCAFMSKNLHLSACQRGRGKFARAPEILALRAGRCRATELLIAKPGLPIRHWG